MWRGGELTPHAKEVTDELRSMGKRLAFLTNNASRSDREVAEKLRALGIEAADGEVVTSGRAVRRVLEDNYLAGRKAFVIAGAGLVEELVPLGLEILDSDRGETADIVVVGLDTGFTYEKLRVAYRAIERGAVFVAANRDATYPVEDGFWPGAGALVAAVEGAARVPPLVAGKPEMAMMKEAESALGGAGPILLIGDRPETDIEGAHRMGWPGALVLTGVSASPDGIVPTPDYVLENLSELISEL